MATDRNQRIEDLEERGGWMKQTVQPSADAFPAGLPPKPDAGAAPAQGAGQGAGGGAGAQQGSAQGADQSG
jgi:hypothetical protein